MHTDEDRRLGHDIEALPMEPQMPTQLHINKRRLLRERPMMLLCDIRDHRLELLRAIHQRRVEPDRAISTINP